MSLEDSSCQQILGLVFDALYLVDLERRITYWNPGAEALTGYAAADVIGKRCCDGVLLHVGKDGRRLCDQYCPLMGAMADAIERVEDIYLQHRDGFRLRVAVRTMPLKDSDGKIVGAAEVFRDQSYREALQERLGQLEKLALIDPVTGLPNRRHTESALRLRLEELGRYGAGFGILFIDIDHFKEVNDRHGHAVGDEVLRLCGRTIQTSLRPFDFLGRWGGEEFIAVILNVDMASLLQVAERTRFLVSESLFNVSGHRLGVTVSVGATLARAGETMEQTVQRADRMMYRSKSGGRNRVSFHD